MKPTFSDLPWVIRERILWNVELYYDSYESSMHEAVRGFGCGNESPGNREAAELHYDQNVDVEQLKVMFAQEVEAAKNLLGNLEGMADDLNSACRLRHSEIGNE